MGSKLAPLRGMKDLLPEDFKVHKHVIEVAEKASKLYGYKGIATPLLENARVFDRTLGEDSDIISKEIYSFKDKKGRLVALRPEFTACIIRAVISHNLNSELPLRFFSSGPVFRYDRPQEGRQRQFYQVNFEHVGAIGAYSDAEIIALAVRFLRELGVLNLVTLELNSLGCAESKKKYQLALVNYFLKYKNDLSDDSKARIESNPLRILDSKSSNDQKLVMNAPIISDYYTKESEQYFDDVKLYLDNLNIEYKVNQRLARGLDYYSHTAFEFITDKLGAQGTVLAGGRYDELSKLMGSEEIPSIGFAAGVERLSLIKDFKIKDNRPIAIIPIDNSCLNYAMNISEQLRNDDIVAIILSKGKVAKRMQYALTKAAKYVIFIGPLEEEKNTCRIKNLDQTMEQEVHISKLTDMIIKNIC